MTDTATDKGTNDNGDATKKTVGKSIAWSDEELLVLAKSAAQVCLDPAVGAQMSKAEMGRRIRSVIIKHELRPDDACTTRDSGDLDVRRWDGRSSDACRKMWMTVRADCTKYYSARKKVDAIELTGNPTDEDMERCYQLVYYKGSEAMSHLYDCVRNKKYFVGKHFKFVTPFKFLESNTQLIQGEGMQGEVVDGDGVMKRTERPRGNKKAKEEREHAEKGKKKTTVEEGIYDVAGCMKKIHESMEQKNVVKRAVESRRIDLESERFWWDKAEKMFGTGSSAPSEERAIAERLMRKRVLASLRMMSDSCENSAPLPLSPRDEIITGVAESPVPDTAAVSVDGTESTMDISVAGESTIYKKNAHVHKMATMAEEDVERSDTPVDDEGDAEENC